MTLKLQTSICSIRPGRIGPKVGEWFHGVAAGHGGFEAELVDLADFHLPMLDEAKHPRMQQYEHDHTKKWAASVASADAYAFVTPEYDYFPPASLVNAVQFVAREWHYKPAGIVSYGGISGGLRAAQAESATPCSALPWRATAWLASCCRRESMVVRITSPSAYRL